MALSPTLPPMCDNTESSVIITGGTQGLGLAVARALIASGCTKITLAGRSAVSYTHLTLPTKRIV